MKKEFYQTKKIFRKAVTFLAVLTGVTFLSFILIYMAPGNPAQMMLEANGMYASDEAISCCSKSVL